MNKTVNFRIEMGSYRKFLHLLEQAPKQARYACRNTLNDIAREVRSETIKQKNIGMTLRNTGLVRKSITYERADITDSISRMESVVGSSGIETRFTGFGEQEGVRVNKRKRMATKLGRRLKKQVIPKEYRANNNFPVVQKMVGKRGLKTDRNVIAYFNRLAHTPGRLKSRFGTNQFMISRTSTYSGKRLLKGIYQFGVSYQRYYHPEIRGGRSRKAILHRFEPLQVSPENMKSKLQPKENQWLRRNTKSYYQSGKAEKRLIENSTKQIELIAKYRR